MNSSVADLIAEVIAKEIRPGKGGHYSNDPNDSGGETAWGVTERVARKYGYEGPMVDMPRTVAENIYEQRFWYEPGFYDVSIISLPIARELFDTGVNSGPERACEFLQKSLNALNRRGKDYPDVDEDFDIGPATLGALKAYLAFRGALGEKVLFRELNSLQGAFLTDLSRRRQKDEDFMFGWLANRVAL